MSWPPLLPSSTQHRDDVSTANGDVSRKGHRQARGEWRSGSLLASKTQSHRLRYWRVAVLLPHKVHSGALCCRVRRNRSSSRPRPPTSRDPRPLPPTRALRLTKHAPCSASRAGLSLPTSERARSAAERALHQASTQNGGQRLRRKLRA